MQLDTEAKQAFTRTFSEEVQTMTALLKLTASLEELGEQEEYDEEEYSALENRANEAESNWWKASGECDEMVSPIIDGFLRSSQCLVDEASSVIAERGCGLSTYPEILFVIEKKLLDAWSQYTGSSLAGRDGNCSDNRMWVFRLNDVDTFSVGIKTLYFNVSATMTEGELGLTQGNYSKVAGVGVTINIICGLVSRHGESYTLTNEKE